MQAGTDYYGMQEKREGDFKEKTMRCVGGNGAAEEQELAGDFLNSNREKPSSQIVY